MIAVKLDDTSCYCTTIDQTIDYIIDLYDKNDLSLNTLLDNIEVDGLTINEVVYIYAAVNKIINRYNTTITIDDKIIDLSIKRDINKLIFDDDKIAFS